MRGIAYQPTPIGSNPAASPPYGDYYTFEYQPIYLRDLKNLRSMHANVVRLYGWEPMADHGNFLDYAWNGGTNSIYVLLNRWINPTSNWANLEEMNLVRDSYITMVTAVKDHPAVLGVAIGNELNLQNGNGTNILYWSAMNYIAQAVKAAAPNKLVMLVNADDGLVSVTNFNSIITNLDVWCLQVYRGGTFGNLFRAYESASTKPMFITEFGMDAFDQSNGQEFPNNAQIVADYFSNLWQEIQTNPVCSGGCVFSYSDEWWKAPGGSPGLHDQGGYMNPNFPDQFLNEEWWGIFSVSNNGSSLNILTPRAVFFQIQELWRPPSAPFALRLMSNQWQTVFLRDSWRPDIIYELASSSTLSNWTTVACSSGHEKMTNVNNANYLITEDSATNRLRTVVVREELPANSAPSRYLRLTIRLD
jgi:hypothetical protein